MGTEEGTETVSEVEKDNLVTETDVTRISADAEWFKDCFKLASALIQTEVQFDIKDDGLLLKQMEEAHIARTDLFLPKVLFKELKKGRFVSTLRLDVKDINAILGKISKGDVVTFSIDRLSENDRVGLLVEIKGRRTNRYRLPLFEAEEFEKRDPKVVFATRVRTNIDGIVDAVDRAKALLSRKGGKKEAWMGTFVFESNPMGIAMGFEADDGTKKGLTQLTNAWDIMQFEGKTGQKVIVSQSYIEAIIKAVAIVTNVVTIEMSTFAPLHITAELPFKGSLAFWLSPRVPEEAVRRATKEGGEHA